MNLSNLVQFHYVMFHLFLLYGQCDHASSKAVREYWTSSRTRSPGGFAKMMGVFWMSGPGGSSLPSWNYKWNGVTTQSYQQSTNPDTITASNALFVLPVVLLVGILYPDWDRTDFVPEVQDLYLHVVASFCVPARTSRADCGRTLTCRYLTLLDSLVYQQHEASQGWKPCLSSGEVKILISLNYLIETTILSCSNIVTICFVDV